MTLVTSENQPTAVSRIESAEFGCVARTAVYSVAACASRMWRGNRDPTETWVCSVLAPPATASMPLAWLTPRGNPSMCCRAHRTIAQAAASLFDLFMFTVCPVVGGRAPRRREILSSRILAACATPHPTAQKSSSSSSSSSPPPLAPCFSFFGCQLPTEGTASAGGQRRGPNQMVVNGGDRIRWWPTEEILVHTGRPREAGRDDIQALEARRSSTLGTAAAS